MGEFASFRDPQSYADGSVATGRATLAGQVKGKHPDKERYLALQVGGWACCKRLLPVKLVAVKVGTDQDTHSVVESIEEEEEEIG